MDYSFEHFGNKGQYHIFIDTVLCRAELSNWDFAVLGTGILRNALAVVGTVDIHLAAAIGTIKQACEGSCFAPAVRVASDIPTDFLHMKMLFCCADDVHDVRRRKVERLKERLDNGT